MPSKNRKSSRTPLKLLNADHSSPSPQVSTPDSREVISEDVTCSLLEEASIRYPSLISKHAFVGRVTDVESNMGSNAVSKIWLSESSMISFSLIPGSIVSVSCASSKKKPLGISPLDSFTDEPSLHHDNDAGCYFALAVLYPSSKVVKNGLQLSSSLACTMGYPSIGKTIFVFPIRAHSIDGSTNECNKLHPSYSVDSPFKFCVCRDLYLKLVPSKSGVRINGDSRFLPEVQHNQLENGRCSSPKTPPLIKSKLSSPAPGDVMKSQDVSSVLPYSNQTIFSTSDIKEALENEKSRELLQTYASLWLNGRFLLNGNHVSIPMGGQTSVFVVQSANHLSTELSDKEFGNDGEVISPIDDSTTDLDRLNIAFVVNNVTKVHIDSGSPLVTQTSGSRSLQPVEPCVIDINDKTAVSNPKLGGLSKEYAKLKEIIISSLVKGSLSSLGLRPIKGVLLHGPPGTGKTSLARSCVIDSGVNLFPVNGPEIIGQFHGESEQALRDIFYSASEALPAVIFIDELDAIAPARKEGGDELSQRIVATLLNLMDGISQNEGIVVIAATNRPDSIDPALRRPGRLDKEIEIGVPSPKQRLDIMQSLLNEMDHALVDTQIQQLALETHGFVGADLALLCNEAALVCLRRHIKLKNSFCSSSRRHNNVQLDESCSGCDGCPDDLVGRSGVNEHEFVESVLSSPSERSVSSNTVQSFLSDTESVDHMITKKTAFEFEEKLELKVSVDDFEIAKRKVRPSAMREVILEIPKVKWEDVGGQKEVKKQLMEAVEWPQKHCEAFKRIGTRPPTGVLMFGPPGCSKTLMARAVATEAGLNFLSVKGPELFSKWVGESEKAVKSVFAKARENAPSVIFFDEIDGLAVTRGKEKDGASVSDRVMSQLLVELDGLHQRVDVTVIAATNRPDKLDPALIRPGRFDRLLYVGPPNEIDREDIFQVHLRKMPCSSDVSIKDLAHLTEGYTGADISLLCREAGLAAIEGGLDTSEISMEHFKIGLGRVQPSEVHGYQDFCTNFQRLVCSGSK